MTPEEFNDAIWEALAPVDRDAFQVVAAPAPSDEEVGRLQMMTTVHIPDDFLAFSRRTNGLAVIARPEVWPADRRGGRAWMFYRGLILLGIDSAELPEWAGIAYALERLAEYGVAEMLPLFKIYGDNERYWGVDGKGRSALFLDGEVRRLDASIAELYAEQIAELVERQKRMAEATDS